VSARFRVLLLPEDAVGEALRELVRKLFREWEDDGKTRRVDFDSLPDDKLRDALRSKAYQAREQAHPKRGQVDRQTVVEFYRYLARRVADATFVIHHTDGDVAWSDRASAASHATRAHVRERLEAAIRTPQPVQRAIAPRGHATTAVTAPTPDDAEVARQLDRFIDCVPY